MSVASSLYNFIYRLHVTLVTSLYITEIFDKSETEKCQWQVVCIKVTSSLYHFIYRLHVTLVTSLNITEIFHD